MLGVEARLLGYADPFGTEATLPATCAAPASRPLCPEGIAVGRHEGKPSAMGDIAPTDPLALSGEGQLLGGARCQREVATPEAAVVLLEGEDGVDTAPVDVDPVLTLVLIRSVVDIVVNVLVEDAGLDSQPILAVVEREDGLVAVLATEGAVAEAP